MMHMSWFSISIIFAVVGSAVVAGVFLAFSSFVMRGLAALPAKQGIVAMQSINITVLNSIFMLFFVGTALLSVVLGIIAILKWGQTGMPILLIACGLYVVGSFLVTIIFNVPLNNTLAMVEPNSTQAIPIWKNYLNVWVVWNHVRTTASLAASGTFIYALLKFFV